MVEVQWQVDRVAMLMMGAGLPIASESQVVEGVSVMKRSKRESLW